MTYNNHIKLKYYFSQDDFTFSWTLVGPKTFCGPHVSSWVQVLAQENYLNHQWSGELPGSQVRFGGVIAEGILTGRVIFFS